MALSPSTVDYKTVKGIFTEKEYGKYFEYAVRKEHEPYTPSIEDYPHIVYVTSPIEGIESGFRYAKVKKTVVYIVTDEDDDGLVVEKWSIKQHREYR